LTDDGFEIVCVANGALGLEHLERNPPPAAILVDLMMPVMDGWTFVERIHSMAHLEETPIGLITASGAHWGYPVPQVLHKPFGRNELIAAVRNLIRPGVWAPARSS
jgi:CheY-like chemotaxis protein